MGWLIERPNSRMNSSNLGLLMCFLAYWAAATGSVMTSADTAPPSDDFRKPISFPSRYSRSISGDRRLVGRMFPPSLNPGNPRIRLCDRINHENDPAADIFKGSCRILRAAVCLAGADYHPGLNCNTIDSLRQPDTTTGDGSMETVAKPHKTCA